MKDKDIRIVLNLPKHLAILWQKHKGVLSIVLVVLGAVVIFGLGVEVGKGQWDFSFWGRGANTNLPSQLDYSSVTEVYRALKNDYNGTVSTTQLLDGLKQGLAESTKDPYTEYFSVSEAKQFNNELNNTFSGIGAELGKDSDGNLIIVAPIKGFPADTAGLQAQDIITAIDGQSTANMAIETAVNKVRGPVDTKVTLGIIRNHAQTLSFTVTRRNIHLPSVTSKMLQNNIAYMSISSFADDTVGLSQQAARQFKQAGAKAVILDLRGNPGGLLNAAVDVSSLWLSQAKLVVTEKGTIGTTSFNASGNDVLKGIPTVVLIDGGTASASEIVAGALHDNGTARLIGDKSFGKGVVQQVVQFGDGSELKVTVASWYRPDGENINKKGITPDQIVLSNSTNTQNGNDPQLNAAITYLSH